MRSPVWAPHSTERCKVTTFFPFLQTFLHFSSSQGIPIVFRDYFSTYSRKRRRPFVNSFTIHQFNCHKYS